MTVVPGERELRAGARGLASDDHPCAVWRELQVIGDLANRLVRALLSVLVQRAQPVVLGVLEDCAANGFGQVIADRVLDAPLPTVVDQLVAGAGLWTRRTISIA
jgi:hypothetical protein